MDSCVLGCDHAWMRAFVRTRQDGVRAFAAAMSFNIDPAMCCGNSNRGIHRETYVALVPLEHSGAIGMDP